MYLDTTENESLVHRARNVAVGRFMQKTDCEYFMFIDADIDFDAESVVRLIKSGHDLSVACYPKKVVMWEQAANAIREGDERNMAMLSSSLVVNFGQQKIAVQNGFIPILDGPTGFMVIKREVFKKLEEKFPELWCKNDHQNRDFDDYHACFDCMIDPQSKRYLSEDYAFCRRWQQCDGKIYADINTTLGHVGNLPFMGCMNDRLKAQSTIICNMKIITVITTRSKSCSVKTLHTILRLNIECIQRNVKNEIIYVNDDPFDKVDTIQRCLPNCDRLFFIDFGVNVDEDSVKQMFEKHEGVGVLVFPGVKEGIDWGLFKHKVKEGSSEPVSQMGLNFDTEVGNKISKDIYSVTSTNPKSWVMFSKNVIKNTKDKKGKWGLNVRMFEKLKEQGVKIYAFTAAKLTMTYPHECISNILNAAGVKTN